MKRKREGGALSSELFINEFIDAIQHNNLVKFRKRYRQADLLPIDDIRLLGGKERPRSSFFTPSIRCSMAINRSRSFRVMPAFRDRESR
jgi:chromosomal replication initiation ATPase DnaA